MLTTLFYHIGLCVYWGSVAFTLFSMVAFLVTMETDGPTAECTLFNAAGIVLGVATIAAL